MSAVFERKKEKNKKIYNYLCREFNNVYLEKPTIFDRSTVEEFDYRFFSGQLVDESCIIQIIEHGSYDDIDELKYITPNLKDLKSIDQKSHIPLDVPVIFLSGRIGYSSLMMPDNQIEETIPIIDELKYNSLLTPINRNKQIQKVSHKLRILHKKYLEIQIKEFEEIMQTKSPSEKPSYQDAIKDLKKEIKAVYGFFNPYKFKKGQTINKYLTFMQGKNAPEDGRTRGIFDILGQDYFESYVNENKSIQGNDNGTSYTVINLGDVIHYMYLQMKKVPKYFIVVDHSCSDLGIELKETINQNVFTKNFYNKHLNVQKRSFNKTRSISKSKLRNSVKRHSI
jgi:hypothetical protein